MTDKQKTLDLLASSGLMVSMLSRRLKESALMCLVSGTDSSDAEIDMPYELAMKLVELMKNLVEHIADEHKISDQEIIDQIKVITSRAEAAATKRAASKPEVKEDQCNCPACSARRVMESGNGEEIMRKMQGIIDNIQKASTSGALLEVLNNIDKEMMDTTNLGDLRDMVTERIANGEDPTTPIKILAFQGLDGLGDLMGMLKEAAEAGILGDNVASPTVH